MSANPGPWRWRIDAMGQLFVYDGNGAEIWSSCGCCGSPSLSGPNAERIAALIAAGPTLLTALADAVAELHAAGRVEAVERAQKALDDAYRDPKPVDAEAARKWAASAASAAEQAEHAAALAENDIRCRDQLPYLRGAAAEARSRRERLKDLAAALAKAEAP